MTNVDRMGSFAAALLLLGASGIAGAKSIDLPPDGVQLTPSSLPGYAKAQVNCVACHSAEYMLSQPPTAPRTYWNNMVHRMRDVFKAPVQEADMADIVDYLSKTYGAEKPKP